MHPIVKNALKCCGHYRQYRFERSCQDPLDAQYKLLRRLTRNNADTFFGKQHGFRDIKSIANYKNRVPIRDYEGHRPYVDRIISGDRMALTRDPPFMFNTTSGTTGAPKHIPWNASIDRASKQITRQWIYNCLKDHPGCLDHRVLCMVSPAEEGMVGGLPFGSASGHIYRSIPAAVRKYYALPYEIFEIDDYDARYFAALRLGLDKRISVISTANPDTLVRLAETGLHHAERLIRAIHDGTLGVELMHQEGLRERIEWQLEPNPGRAVELEKLVRFRGSLYPRDYWPDLRLIGCWTGGSIGSRIASVFPYYGRVPVRDLGFLASEARMSVPIADHTPEGILSVDTAFYEFIPESEIDYDHPETLLCNELEVGKRYHIVLTTPAGLYRYDINDVIEITGHYRNCPKIVFIRKGRDMTSITGEKLHVNHCIAAMQAVEKLYGESFTQFRFAADAKQGCYQVYIEPARPGRIPDSLADAIDAALFEQNMEYAQKRRSFRLRAPVLYVMKEGWADNEIRSTGSSGRRCAEFKWRYLLPEPRPQDMPWIQATLHREAIRHIA